ncbi:MAG: DUF7144 family membrane protein [Gaiella sp.]
MSTTPHQTLPYEDSTSSGLYYEARPAGYGLLVFAMAMMAIAGIWAVVEGIAAIAGSRVFTANAVFVFSSLNTWGWIVLGLGALMLLAAFTLFSGSQLARWFGIVAAGLNAIGQLLFVQAYPLWSMAMFAACVVVIYALATYAGPKLRDV